MTVGEASSEHGYPAPTHGGFLRRDATHTYARILKLEYPSFFLLVRSSTAQQLAASEHIHIRIVLGSPS